ncbi:potassium channel family protein [Curtobacterium sp. MCSS17_005]|uniref:potassium channel family protein n=1 Tax=Curtobacterium sp. MCSS17_005 TaxID=2175641 RepID=UPI000DAA5800|nr:potassium channel family protein [Curtobacterium sp. MCSS17_005]WIB33261.1 potassium channel family protein [Curtobacterium sp. MCSS17_005]
MSWIATAAGVLLIIVGFREVFFTLLRPLGRGRLTRVLAQSTWRALRRRAGTRVHAGPVIMVAVLSLWTVLQVLGWALLYLPFVPAGFAYSSGSPKGEYPRFVEALYISSVNLSTLGLGDVTPTALVVRVLSPLQALVGFGLLTAGVSWFLQTYPALGRRRALAVRLAALSDASSLGELARMNPVASASLLHGLAADLAQVRVDLTQNSESYYFSEQDRRASLPSMLPYALAVARSGQRSHRSEVRVGGAALEAVVSDLAALLGEQFLKSKGPTDELLRQYGASHRPW